MKELVKGNVELSGTAGERTSKLFCQSSPNVAVQNADREQSGLSGKSAERALIVQRSERLTNARGEEFERAFRIDADSYDNQRRRMHWEKGASGFNGMLRHSARNLEKLGADHNFILYFQQREPTGLRQQISLMHPGIVQIAGECNRRYGLFREALNALNPGRLASESSGALEPQSPDGTPLTTEMLQTVSQNTCHHPLTGVNGCDGMNQTGERPEWPAQPIMTLDNKEGDGANSDLGKHLVFPLGRDRNERSMQFCFAVVPFLLKPSVQIRAVSAVHPFGGRTQQRTSGRLPRLSGQWMWRRPEFSFSKNKSYKSCSNTHAARGRLSAPDSPVATCSRN